MNRKNISSGFSLIELIVVVAIVAILASVAIPSWVAYMQKGRRADAISSLLNLQLQQEKWRSSDIDYATLAELGWTDGNGNSTDGYYTISVTANGTSTFTAIAAPVGQQSNDKCGSFAINQDGPVYTSYANADCWGH